MTIAVLDGGFANVDRLSAFKNVKVTGARDFVFPRSTDIYNETDHGTKVLSTMAMNAPTVYIGTAPDASYWLLRCEDQQTEQPVEEDYWAMAAEFADSVGVDIISSSLGYNEYDNATELNFDWLISKQHEVGIQWEGLWLNGESTEKARRRECS